MAQNKVRVTIRVNDDGTYELVTKKAKKLREEIDKGSASTEKAYNKRNAYNRQEKGVANNTSNSTKAFAKQAQTIGGTLVPAYATLAANVFAATAVFSALRNAAALEQLEAGLVAVGSAAGRNLPYLSDQLREITGNAISSQAAMQSTALATSAGFSADQLMGLTKVAKGASLALGRDMEDAMNRLTRGAAKLEPEILDELGIMVRLDDAATKYAAALGRTANELTIFERRQAFANEIIEQGTKKFGQIAEIIDPNPYDQLAATFNDLVRSIFDGVNLIAKPIAELFSNSPGGLLGGMVLFGSTIAGQMLPALNDMAERSYASAEALSDQADKTNNATRATKLKYLSVIKGHQADAIASASAGKLGESLKFIRASYIDTAGAAVATARKSGTLTAAFGTLRAASVATSTAVRSLGAAFLSFMPYLGLIFMGISLLAPHIMKLFGKEKNVLEEETKKATKSFSSFKDINDSLALSLSKTSDETERYVLESRAVAGVADQISASFSTLANASNELKQQKIQETFLALQEAQKKLDDLQSSGSPTGGRSRSGMIKALEAEVVTLTAAFDAANKAAAMPNTQEAVSVVESAIRALEGEDTLTDAAKNRLMNLNAVLSQLKEAKTNKDIEDIFSGLSESTRAFVSNLDGIAESFSQFSAVVAKRTRGAGPFAKEVEASQSLLATLVQTTDQEERNALAKEATGIFAGKTADQIEEQLRTLKEVNTQLALSKIEQKILQEQARRLSEVASVNAETTKQKVDLEEKSKQLALEALDATYEQETILRGQALTEAEIKEYKAERLKILNSMLSAEQQRAVFLQAEARDKQRILDLENKRVAAQRKIIDAELEGRRLSALEKAATGVRPRTSLNAAEEFKLIKDSLEQRKKAIAEIAKEERNRINATAQEEIRKLEKSKADPNISETARQDLQKEIDLRQALLSDQIFASLDQEEIDKRRLEIEKQIAKLKASQAAGAAAGQGDTTADRIFNFGEAGGIDALNLGQEKVKALSLLVSPMVEDLKKLGPQGELVAAVAQGGLMISESWAKVGDTFANSTDKMEKVSAVAGAIANTLSSVASIASAASNARVAGIDAEIEAEKKRDGKSAQSLAKLQQLEARKDKEKRKAFEVNKKLMLAQAVMSTAAGVAGALSQTGALGPFAIPLAAMIAAMGAAQIAIISGTSYQSSSSSVSAAAPSQVSLGQRQSSVDLARSSSAAGEIGYMRGEQGVGSSASSFRPAFTGMKYRASGGAVAGYMVGEQGPEMFVPDVPGRIVPADETGRGGGTSNVNFTINAVDAAGIEEVLVGQRGNIIGMLREAANAHGQEFLEAIDVSVYTAPNRRTV